MAGQCTCVPVPVAPASGNSVASMELLQLRARGGDKRPDGCLIALSEYGVMLCSGYAFAAVERTWPLGGDSCVRVWGACVGADRDTIFVLTEAGDGTTYTMVAFSSCSAVPSLARAPLRRALALPRGVRPFAMFATAASSPSLGGSCGVGVVCTDGQLCLVTKPPEATLLIAAAIRPSLARDGDSHAVSAPLLGSSSLTVAAASYSLGGKALCVVFRGSSSRDTAARNQAACDVQEYSISVSAECETIDVSCGPTYTCGIDIGRGGEGAISAATEAAITPSVCAAVLTPSGDRLCLLWDSGLWQCYSRASRATATPSLVSSSPSSPCMGAASLLHSRYLSMTWDCETTGVAVSAVDEHSVVLYALHNQGPAARRRQDAACTSAARVPSAVGALEEESGGIPGGPGLSTAMGTSRSMLTLVVLDLLYGSERFRQTTELAIGSGQDNGVGLSAVIRSPTLSGAERDLKKEREPDHQLGYVIAYDKRKLGAQEPLLVCVPLGPTTFASAVSSLSPMQMDPSGSPMLPSPDARVLGTSCSDPSIVQPAWSFTQETCRAAKTAREIDDRLECTDAVIAVPLEQAWDSQRLAQHGAHQARQQEALLSICDCPGEAELLIKLFTLWQAQDNGPSPVVCQSAGAVIEKGLSSRDVEDIRRRWKRSVANSAPPLLAPRMIAALVDHCCGQRWWVAIEILISSGYLRSPHMCPGLLSLLIHQKKLDLIELLLLNSPELGPRELAILMKLFLSDGELAQVLNSSMARKRARAAQASKQAAAKRGRVQQEELRAVTIANTALEHFSAHEVALHAVVAPPRDTAVIKSVIQSLTVAEAFALLQYVAKWATQYTLVEALAKAPPSRRPLPRVPALITLIQYSSLLLDVHLLGLALRQDAIATLQELQAFVRTQVNLCHAMQLIQGAGTQIQRMRARESQKGQENFKKSTSEDPWPPFVMDTIFL